VKESDRKKKVGQERKIRELEEKIKKLEEAKAKEKREDLGGVAGGVLRGIGEMIPGLGGLIKGLEKSEAFQERLKAINKEVDRKLKEEPLKRVEGRAPHIRTSFSHHPLVKGKPSFKEKVKKPPAPKPKEPLVDVFDEGDHLRIIAELPGVEEKDIKVSLTSDKLTISADTPNRKYHQAVTLPCAPKGKLKKAYRKGVLEIRIQKADQD